MKGVFSRATGLVGLILLGSSFAQYRSNAAVYGFEKPCPRPVEYWRRLEPSRWPLQTFQLGGQRYGLSLVQSLLEARLPPDPQTYTPIQMRTFLLQQMVAAKLSLASGAEPSPVVLSLVRADEWLALGQINGLRGLAETFQAYADRHFTPGCAR